MGLYVLLQDLRHLRSTLPRTRSKSRVRIVFRQPPPTPLLEQGSPASCRQELHLFSQLDSGGPGAHRVKWYMTPIASFLPCSQCFSDSAQVTLIFSLAQFTVGRSPAAGAVHLAMDHSLQCRTGIGSLGTETHDHVQASQDPSTRV